MPFGVVTPPWLAYRILLLLGLLVGRFQADTPAELAIAGVFAALSALGLPWLARRKPKTILLLAPLLAAILASALRILPLSNRVAMFVAPVLLLLSLAGVDQIRAWLPLRAKRLANLAILGMAAIPAAILIFFYPPPDRKEEARPVLEELRARWRPGDRIYITGSSRLAMEYYGRPLGLEWEEATPGSGHPRELLEQADRLRGAPRAWVFYTHAIPCRQQLLRAYLETIGAEVDRIEDPYGLEGKSEAAAHLYDLADPARLSLAGAASFPVPDRIAEHCGYPEDDPWTQVQEQLEEIDPFE
jgi:hypothetical protein